MRFATDAIKNADCGFPQLTPFQKADSGCQEAKNISRTTSTSLFSPEVSASTCSLVGFGAEFESYVGI